jgi:type III secretion protein W
MVEHIEHVQARAAQAAQTGPVKHEMHQVESAVSFAEQVSEVATPFGTQRNQFRKLDERLKTEGKREGGSPTGRVRPVEQARRAAKDFSQQRNPELDPEDLVECLEEVAGCETAGDVAETASRFFKDPTLRDDAYDYLLDMCTDDELKKRVQQAAQEFRQDDRNQMAIKAGRNMTQQARDFQQQGLGTPTELRDLYREILDKRPGHQELFKLLSKRYKFDVLEKAADFLFQSLGSDLRSQGPSIEPAFLKVLVDQTRALQNTLGVYGFFEKRTDLIKKESSRQHIDLPAAVTFESLSNSFMELVDDKYPSPIKVFNAAQKLGVTDSDPHAQVLVLNQFRDAVRGVSPNLFPQAKSSQELSTAILGALEQVELRIDELEAQ